MRTKPKTAMRQRPVPPSIPKSLARVLGEAEVLLVVPPFHTLEYPSFGLHLLQACGREAGLHVRILYANMLLASVIGEPVYSTICDANDGAFTGERFFARCAFTLPPLGRRPGHMYDADWMAGRKRDWKVQPTSDRCRIPLRKLRSLERRVAGYVDSVATAICNYPYRIVGCTTCFEQTAASVALLNRIKRLRPDIATIIGGANCEAEMARGLAALPSRIDYIFSGESEATFPEFVRALLAGVRPRDRIISGEPCANLDALPTPDFLEYYRQLKKLLPRSTLSVRETEIPYETSRGCWWGQKHHCTFCGMNDATMRYRQKSPDRVIEELHRLLSRHPSKSVVMLDNVMPHTYFQTLLHRLTTEISGASIFYEQRANLSLSQIVGLKRAGVTSIQVGVEALSSRLLSLMNKGVLARQNLVLLRNLGAAGVELDWNLLWGLPGDNVEAYNETLALIPLLHHLQPPVVFGHVSIDRFSPYFSRPVEFGLRDVKPLAGCHDFLPRGADIERIAYPFTAEYPCGSHDHVEVITDLWRAVNRWQASWDGKRGRRREQLRLRRRNESYLLRDTRRIWRTARSYSLNEADASTVVTARRHSGKDLEAWAVREKLAVIADGWFVPLATADPELLLELTGEHKQASRTLSDSG